MSRLPPSSAVRYFRSATLRWYRRTGRSFAWRRASAPLYHQIVVEVLLQRTRAETVQAFLSEFLVEYPSWRSLAESSPSAIAEVVRPIGLWQRRGMALHALGLEMARRRGRFPLARKEIEELPAVGQYVANAIELFAFDRPRPLLDSGMARVLERYFGPRELADIRYDPYLQALSARVVRCAKPKEINWAVLDLAAAHCRPTGPTCTECPLRRRCLHVRANRPRKCPTSSQPARRISLKKSENERRALPSGETEVQAVPSGFAKLILPRGLHPPQYRRGGPARGWGG